jgi:hypothetical protein
MSEEDLPPQVQEAIKQPETPLPETPEDKHMTRNFIIAVIIIVVAFAIVMAGYKYFTGKTSNPTVTVNGFVFEYYGDLWNAQWQKDGTIYNIRMHFNPQQVEGINIAGMISENFGKNGLFVTLDPEANESEGNDSKYTALAAIELNAALINAFDLSPVVACTRNSTDSCKNLSIVTCENTNSSVIYIRQSNEKAVTLIGNCIVIEGPGKDVVEAADRLLYSFYGILR